MYYEIYFHDEVVATSDASEAVAVYWDEVGAGTRPAIWRGDDPIVHITKCPDCQAPVLMTLQDVNAYVGAFGELEDGVLCGVLGQTDLFRGALLRALGYGSRAEKQLLESLSVKEAMRENPITTGADVALAKAARLMREHQVRCLPVVDGERLLGMLSESDFVRVVAES